MIPMTRREERKVQQGEQESLRMRVKFSHTKGNTNTPTTWQRGAGVPETKTHEESTDRPLSLCGNIRVNKDQMAAHYQLVCGCDINQRKKKKGRAWTGVYRKNKKRYNPKKGSGCEGTRFVQKLLSNEGPIINRTSRPLPPPHPPLPIPYKPTNASCSKLVSRADLSSNDT